jgi:hypothetical protein
MPNFLASTVLAAVGSPAAGYIASSDLPPVESARFDKPKRRRSSGSGSTIVGGFIDSYDTNRETKGDKWYGSFGVDGISAKMMRNPHVRQSVAYVTNPLTAADWRFKSASKAPRDREVADFCTHAFCENLPWDSIVERMIGDGAKDGFSVSEMLDDNRPISADRFPSHPRPAAALVPIDIAEVPNNTIQRWYQNAEKPTEVDWIEQWQPYSDVEKPGPRPIRADRIVRLTIGQRGAEFTGFPILRSAYGPWKLLDAAELFRAIGLERTAVGNPVAIASENVEYGSEEIDAIEELLENMRTMAKGAMVLPGGYKIEWSGAGENDIGNLNIAIESFKTDIAVNVTAGFTRLGLTGPGSYALANTAAGQYHLATVGWAKLLARSFNLGVDGWSPVRRIVEANYGVGTPLPTLMAYNLPTRDIEKVLNLTYKGVSARVITPDDALEEETRGMLQLGPHDPESSRSDTRVSTVRSSRSASQIVDTEESMDDEVDAEVDADSQDTGSESAAPDDTTPKEEQTIFGYHLQYGVAKINEARRNLGLDEVDYGNVTVPEFLKGLDQLASDGSDPDQESEESDEGDMMDQVEEEDGA